MGLLDEFFDGVFDFVDDVVDAIFNAIDALGDAIVRFFLTIVRFVKNIVGFFKSKGRLAKLQRNRNLLAVSVKRNLADGNYNVVNCLFNKKTGELSNPEEDSEVIESEDLDAQTEAQFGDKDMIVLQ